MHGLSGRATPALSAQRRYAPASARSHFESPVLRGWDADRGGAGCRGESDTSGQDVARAGAPRSLPEVSAPMGCGKVGKRSRTKPGPLTRRFDIAQQRQAHTVQEREQRRAEQRELVPASIEQLARERGCRPTSTPLEISLLLVAQRTAHSSPSTPALRASRAFAPGSSSATA